MKPLVHHEFVMAALHKGKVWLGQHPVNAAECLALSAWLAQAAREIDGRPAS